MSVHLSVSEPVRDAFEEIARNLVIPRRSIGRVRAALRRGDSPEAYIEDLEQGIMAAYDLAREMASGPPACPACNGTGEAA